MPNASVPLCLVEQADFVIRVIRCAGSGRPLRIDAVHEFSSHNPASLADAAASLFPAGSIVVGAVRPKSRRIHVSSADEAKRFPGANGARQFAATAAGASPPAWAAVVATAGDKGDARWVLELGSAEGRAAVASLFESLKLTPARHVSALTGSVGVLAGHGSTPAWLVEFGELESHALLVSNGTVQVAGALSLNLDKIAEAVQTELALKFRGSAAKLFFNDDYDFSDVGPKIAERLAPNIQGELAKLRGGYPAPAFVFSTGLPARQQWFGDQLAAALGMKSLQPDIKAWSAANSVAFATPELAGGLSPAWMGPLHLLQRLPADASTPVPYDWASVDGTAAPVPIPTEAPKVSVPAPAKPVVSSPAAAIKVTTTQSKVLEPVTAKAAGSNSNGKHVPTVMPVFLENNEAATTRTPKAPATESAVRYPPKPASPSRLSTESSVTYPARIGPPGKNGSGSDRRGTPVIGEPRMAVSTVVGGAVAKTLEDSGAGEPRPRKTPWFRRPAFVGIAAACVVAVAGAFVYLQTQKAEEQRLAAEKARAEERIKAEAEKARQAEMQAHAEAEARKKFEQETMQKLASVEAARQQAEAEARAQAAARLANARGTLVVSTDPAGAKVTIDGLPAATAPATFPNIKIGRYSATVALPNYESVKVDVEVKEDATTDTGVIHLTRLVGTLSLTSVPAGIDYEVRPANVTFVALDSRRSGKTPAILDDLAPGEYTVTYTRDGWEPHTQTIAIGRGATANASWQLTDGVIKIASTPTGAAVMRGTEKLGVTPLTLTAQSPGDVSFELSMPGRDTVRVGGHLDAGQVLTLSRKLEMADRIATLNELDQLPIAIVSPKPILSPPQGRDGGSVVIQLIVDREGHPRDIEVVKSTSSDLERAVLNAIAKWKFKPGMIGGKPVNTRVSVPFNFDAE